MWSCCQLNHYSLFMLSADETLDTQHWLQSNQALFHPSALKLHVSFGSQTERPRVCAGEYKCNQITSTARSHTHVFLQAADKKRCLFLCFYTHVVGFSKVHCSELKLAVVFHLWLSGAVQQCRALITALWPLNYTAGSSCHSISRDVSPSYNISVIISRVLRLVSQTVSVSVQEPESTTWLELQLSSTNLYSQVWLPALLSETRPARI